MKKRKIALFDPYLDVLGGGERHILSIIKALINPDDEVHIFWDNDIRKKIEQKFGIAFTRLQFRQNIFRQPLSVFQKIFLLHDYRALFYVTDGSYFFSTAKKNYIFCMVPKKELYPTNSFIFRLKTRNYQFICNSQFTQRWLKKWNINSQVIYPYVDSVFLNKKNVEKEPIILAVGRFFPQLHTKKQEVIIKAFHKIKSIYPQTKNYRLVIVGSIKTEDANFINKLYQQVANDPSISILPNVSYHKIVSLYQRAAFFWHFTGYGVDENKEPEKMEHLGIAPLEAMAAGAIVFCYNGGGPKEFIQHKKNGFLFKSIDELGIYLNELVINTQKQQKIRQEGIKTINKQFTFSVFQQNIRKYFSF